MTIFSSSPQTFVFMAALHIAAYCVLSLLPTIGCKFGEVGSKYLIQTQCQCYFVWILPHCTQLHHVFPALSSYSELMF